MTKKTKIIISLVCAAVAVILLVTLLCVFLIKDDPYKIDGQGSVTVTKNEDGTRTLTAQPNKWNEFVGWYESVDGQLADKPVSQELSYVIDDDAPVYTAVFASSAINSLDRLLNGVYNTYKNGIASQQDYFNFSGDITLNFAYGDINMNLDISAGGFFNFEGRGNELYLTAKEHASGMNMLGAYYVDNGLDANLYINLLGNTKTIVVPSLSSVFTGIGELSPYAWSIRNILNGALDSETANLVYSVIDSVLGITNAQGFYASAANDASTSSLSLRLGVMLKNLNDLLGNLNLGEQASEIISSVLGIFTSEYPNSLLPSITLDLNVNYEELNGEEVVDNIDVAFKIADDYKINVGEVVTIGKTDVNLTINEIDMGFAPIANAIDRSELAIFPDAINLLNMHVGGELAFVNETQSGDDLSTILDRIDLYNVDLYTDINPLAITNARGGDGSLDVTKIDWENLGMLSLRISLDKENSDLTGHYIDDADTSNVVEQDIVDDYLNIYMDTEKYGAKLFVFASLYNPSIHYSVSVFGMPMTVDLTQDYILNTVFDIPTFIAYMSSVAESQPSDEATTISSRQLNATTLSNEETQAPVAQTISFGFVLDIITRLIGGEDANSIIYSILETLLPSIDTDGIVTNNLSYSADYGLMLKLQDYRDLLSNLLASDDTTDAGDSSFDIASILQLDNLLFGENSTHLAIKFTEFDYAVVTRVQSTEGELGDYVNENNESILGIYNKQHLTAIGVENLYTKQGGAGGSQLQIEDMTFDKDTFVEEIKAIDTIYSDQILYSDGSLQNEISNIIGSRYEGRFGILDVQVLSQNDTSAEVTIVLRRAMQDNVALAAAFGSPLPAPFDTAMGVEDILYILGFPYGVYTYTTTVKLEDTADSNINLSASIMVMDAQATINGYISGAFDTTGNISIGSTSFDATTVDETTFQNIQYGFDGENPITLQFTITNNSSTRAMTARIDDLATENLASNINYTINEGSQQTYSLMEDITVDALSTINFYITLNTNDSSIDINDIILSFSLSQAAE